MTEAIAVEICVESVDAAVEAERGGADRIELCAALAVGGVTPDAAAMEQARSSLSGPVHVIIRTRGGGFCYSPSEFVLMKEQIRNAKDLGMDGIVVGILDAERRVDVERSRKLVQLAHPLPVTFHRAFDEARDLFEALEAVIQTGATRLLTSGGQPTAAQGSGVLAKLAIAAAGRISIMPGSGITAANAVWLIRRTGAHEIHGSLGPAKGMATSLERRVRDLKATLREQVGRAPSH
jgi:copper homeostasis protein